MEHKNWNGFKKGIWQEEINVRDFIQQNYKEYMGDDSFLAGATERTVKLNEKYLELQARHIKERVDLFGGKLYMEFGEPYRIEHGLPDDLPTRDGLVCEVQLYVYLAKDKIWISSGIH